MAAGASPTVYDPKNLFRDADVNSADVTEYTATTAEAGTRVMSMAVINTTSAPILFSAWRRAGGVNYAIIGDPGTATASIDATGYPIQLPPMFLNADEEIHAIAGAATGLDFWADGIEMKD